MGSVERLESENIPFGHRAYEKYKTGVTRLEHGDLLVIYTDGVTEARNEEDQEFSETRLLTMVQAANGERSALTLANIMRDLDDFVGAAPQHDDLTCLVVGRS